MKGENGVYYQEKENTKVFRAKNVGDRNAFDLDEADEDIEHPLQSKEQFYNVLLDTVKTLL